MKVKTSELIGTALDWAVGHAMQYVTHDALGWTVRLPVPSVPPTTTPPLPFPKNFSPSTRWAQGGPIIEREEICTKRQAPASVGYEWNAWIWTKHTAKGGSNAGGSGPTPLVAAMRCYVASKLGDEIDIPKELT